MNVRAVCVAALLFGCGKGDSKAGSSAGSATGSAGGGSATGSGGAAMAAAGSGGGSANIAAIDPKVTAARCTEHCLFLVDTPLDKLGEAIKAACPGAEIKELANDDCHQLDYYRNCLFAAHGLAFEKRKWQKAFKVKPWYTVKPDFKASMITAAERATVTDLNDRGKACKKGVTISAADMKVVTEWFAALPKAPPPPRGIVDDEKAKPADLVKAVVGELSGDKKMKSYKLDDKASIRYAKPGDEDPAPLTAAEVGAPADAKIRTVVVDIDAGTVGDEENPILEGTYIRFAFDDKNTLLAIAVRHYLYD